MLDHSKLAFGYMISCHKICEDIGLTRILKESMPNELTNEVIAVASFMLTPTNGGLSAMEDFTSKHMCFNNTLINSQRLSDLYVQINDELRNSFFIK